MTPIETIEDFFDFFEYIDALRQASQKVTWVINEDSIDIYFVPKKPIKYITFNFVAVPNGITFEEVVGNNSPIV